ncbi:division/cell wall cluster transcriptional repressor MraZ [Marinilabiliaceae bacterium ANBcel2]|nr:division/cell wall cluster transcriptional repressor MraZ [Marinilabiliaceae bacterium ANBcel2]
MTTFIGDFECRADTKGRIVMPSAFKKALGEDELRFVVRKDLFENCLVIYPYSFWKEELIRLRGKLNPYNRKHNRFMRDFFSGSAEFSLDSNGRFLLPKRLLNLVDIDRDVVLIGVDQRIELWSAAEYKNIGCDSEELAGLAEDILGEKHDE